MGKLILILLLLVSHAVSAQTPPGYTKINAKYAWIGGKMDSTFTIPSGPTPSLRGGPAIPGSLFFRTTDSSLLVYTGYQWVLAGSSGAALTDGDKGSITVSGSGTVWTINNLSIINAMINDVAWGKITGSPTTLFGYGIADAVINTRTLTINGVTFDLQGNRVWTVGDLLSSSSYTNPIWLVSIPYSKLTTVPVSTPSVDGILDNVDYVKFDAKPDTTATYTSFRASTGTSKTMILKDPRTGGTFHQVATGAENGATIIVLSDGRKFQRDFDSTYWRPEWYEIYGIDRNGASYSRTASGGLGIGSEADAIDNIVLLAGPGAKIRYQPGKIYEIDQMVQAKNRQEHLSGHWKRAAPVVTRLSNSESIGSTSIEVVDASNLRSGMTFLIKGAGTNGGFDDNSNGNFGNEYHTIISISSNTLTIASGATGITKAMAAGDTLVTVAPMLYRLNGVNGGSDSDQHLIIRDFILDGNSTQNRYFVDYQQPGTVSMFGGHLVADNVTFKNIPGENIYAAGGNITNCFAYNLQGSFAHGTNVLNNIDSIYREFVVTNLIADSIGLGDSGEQYHSESTLWTNSALTPNSRWINCRVTNAGGPSGPAKPYWNGNSADGIVQVFGGIYINARLTIDLTGLDSNTAKGSPIIIQDAIFTNTGTWQITGTDVRRGNGVKNVIIKNNTITNSRFFFDNISYFDFLNNKCLTDSATYRRWDDTRSSGVSGGNFLGIGGAALFILTPYADRVNIIGNTFSGFDNDSILMGVQLQLSDSVYRKEANLMTDEYYCQNLNFNDNTIEGFQQSTHLYQNSFAKRVANWNMNNNTITLPKYTRWAADYTFGLQIPPGAVARGGTYTGQFANNFCWPVMVYGVKSAGNENKIEGGTIENATIKGIANWGINVDPYNSSPYNTVVTGNKLLAGIIRFSTDAGTYLLEYSGNKLISNATMNAYERPKHQRTGEGKTQYIP